MNKAKNRYPTKSRYKLAQHRLRMYSDINNLSKTQRIKKKRAHFIIARYEKLNNLNAPSTSHFTHISYTKPEQITGADKWENVIKEKNFNVEPNFCKQTKNCERETAMEIFAAGPNSFVSDSYHNPFNVQSLAGDNFQLLSNELVKYYPSNSPSREVLVSKRALDYELELMNTNGHFTKECLKKKPQFEHQDENVCLPVTESHPQPMFNANREQLVFETTRFPLHRQTDNRPSRNFEANKQLCTTFLPNSYGPHNKEVIFSDKNAADRENYNFPQPSANDERGSFSIAEPLTIARSHLTEQNSCDRISRNTNLPEQSQFALEKRIYEYLNTMAEATMPKDDTPTLITNHTSKPQIEVIALSDDSDVKNVPIVHLNSTSNLKSENHKVQNHIKQRNKTSFLSNAERRRIRKCRQMIRKYRKICKARVKKTGANSKVTSRDTNHCAAQQPIAEADAKHSVTFTQTSNIPLSSTANNPTQTNIPANEQSRSELHIAIIDRNNEDLKISKNIWLEIEKQLLEYLSEEMERTGNTNIGMFGGMYHQYDIKIVQCGNVEALNFIKRFVIKQNISQANWRLDVVPVKDLPLRSIIKVSLPSSSSSSSSAAMSGFEDKSAFEIIKAQNNKVGSEDWILINGRQTLDKTSRDLFVSISSASLEELKLRKFEIRYGSSTLQISVPHKTEY